MTFEKELEEVINRHSQENGSNTPDFILAQYLASCLAAWNAGVQQRETWYGRDARPSGGNGPSPQAAPKPEPKCEECGVSAGYYAESGACIHCGACPPPANPEPQATSSEHYGKCPCGHAYSAHMGGGQCLIPGCGCGAYAGPETQATPKPKPEDKFAFTLRVGDENFKKLSPDLQEQIRAMLAGYPNPPKPQAAPKRCLSCESVFGVEVHHINPCERGKATTGKECANPWCSKSVPCVKCEKPNGQESR